jgi:predicted ATPase
LNKGLTLLLSMPDSAWRRENELTLQIAIGSALIATMGPAARSVGEAYKRAEQLWEILGRPSHFEPKLALFWHQFARGELGTATETAKELIQIADTRNDAAIKFIGRLYLADVCLDRGDFVDARDHAESSLALFDPTSVSRRFLPNGQVAALVCLSLSQFWLGYLDQARLTMDQALLEARRLAHPFTLVAALLGALRIEWAVGSTQNLLNHAEELIALGFDTVGQAPMFRDWCLSVLRETSEGAATLKKAWFSYRETGALRCAPLFLMLFANALEKAGHRSDALEQLAEALRLVAVTEERWCEAELHRVKGELQKVEREYESAEASFRQALAVARRQNAKTWELRAGISLARLWRDQGKWIDASNLLEPVYGWFTEGFDTPNLQEAKALLDQLNLHLGRAVNEPKLTPKRGT